MSNSYVFISHSSKDDAFVKELRAALEDQGLSVWADSRNLRGGAKLTPEIEEAITGARQVLVVISPQTVNSPWVRREIKRALDVEQQRGGEGYKVIPLLLPGIEFSALSFWFDDEPVGARAGIEVGELGEALPGILAALGARSPDGARSIQESPPRLVAELKLRLKDARFEQIAEGVRRVTATAQLSYDPADASRSAAESGEFKFTAPRGQIEAEDLRWYLESYYLWPVGVFIERARRIEAQLPLWGRDLYEAATADKSAQKLLADWHQADEGIERRFSIIVDGRTPEAVGKEEAASDEAASALLSLPWELLHDGRSYLFHGKHPVRVRRCLAKERSEPPHPTSLPIRILLVSPRPEDKSAAYTDHRASALPLVEAFESLGSLVDLKVLTPPTFPALQAALREASGAGKPFHVVHFDGHSVYDREHGLSALCFEGPQDAEKLEGRRSELVYASKPQDKPASDKKYLADLVREHHIPLVFLGAGRGATTEEIPAASVAAALLEEGVASVVAMSHGVLTETARRFFEAFYKELAQGQRVGTAMLAAQRALHDDTWRGKVMGAGDLFLQDWSVPVLYQIEQDPQLITKLPPRAVRQLQAEERRLSFGYLPGAPPHGFHGRSRELLALERLLSVEPYAVIRGQDGAGKTTLAVELARWLTRAGRFRQTAFVSLEQYNDARSVLESLGRQLLPEADAWSVVNFPDWEQALQPITRSLADRPTIIVLDNLESLLPDRMGQWPSAAAPIEELFDLCRRLLEAGSETKIVFTSREPLPAPFDNKSREIALGPLSQNDAVELVSEVLRQKGLSPGADDSGLALEGIIALVEAVNRHARALVLLAREISRCGLRATAESLRQLMVELREKYPDDPENSLHASLELSLRRLSTLTREQLKLLGVFHRGANLMVLALMLGAEPEALIDLSKQLVGVGLAEDMGYYHLRLDPALPSYLLREMSAAERDEATLRWAEGMKQLTLFLYEQRLKDAELAARMALLELPNLIKMLEWMEDNASPEETVDLANRVESILSTLGRPQALAQATSVRERASQTLGDWSHARFTAESASIDQMLERGDVREAAAAALQLCQRSVALGEAAYAGAGYDIAVAYVRLGRVLKMGGLAEEALATLNEAQKRFQALADAGDTNAARMASVAITDTGDCLTALGRLDEAAAVYQEAISRDQSFDDLRSVAVSKGQLGTVRLLQHRYAEALEIYNEALGVFERLGEPLSVASVWHQIGIAYREAGQFEQAERAYRQSLAITVQQKNLAGEAGSLGELGSLYATMERLEEAEKCYRQAADIYSKLGDSMREGIARNNLSNILIKLKNYDEARHELRRVVEYDRRYGHAAQPWTAWSNLQALEQATGNTQAAADAQRRAVESYLAYRRTGGESRSPHAQVYKLIAQAIRQGEATTIGEQLTYLAGEDIPEQVKALISKLQAILRGERDLTLTTDPNLFFLDAVELQLLLEAVQGA